MKEMKSLSDAGRRVCLEANDVLKKRVKIRQYNQNWLIKETIQSRIGEEKDKN